MNFLKQISKYFQTPAIDPSPKSCSEEEKQIKEQIMKTVSIACGYCGKLDSKEHGHRIYKRVRVTTEFRGGVI